MASRRHFYPVKILNIENVKFDICQLVAECADSNLFDYSDYNDIKASSGSKMVPFVISNSYVKSSFFSEENAAYLEGDNYRQKYVTELYEDVLGSNTPVGADQLKLKNDSISNRLRRLKKTSSSYNPFADELNYGKRNKLAKGVVAEILDYFESKVTRVRFAMLAPHFSIKPHIDYDTSYIMRYHFPILTNQSCKMHVIREGKEKSVHFPADGRLYFLNAGYKHWASNDSSASRLHLIVDVHGQHELKNIKEIG